MGRSKLCAIVSTSLCLLLLALQKSAANKRTLVLLQNSDAKDTYSIFFDSLAAYGFTIEYKGYKEPGLKLKDYDTWLYDHLVIFAPKAEGFGGSIDVNGILEFIDSGHNVLVAASSDVSDTIHTLASECGVDLDERGTKVYDYFTYGDIGAGEADPTIIATLDVVHSPAIFGKDIKVTVALTTPLTSYSHDARKAMPEPPILLVGSGASLVSLVQARNNARVMISGSLDLFSNQFLDAPVTIGATGQKYERSGNREFAINAARWTFQDRGVIKAENLRHHVVGSEAQPTLYRVNDEVEFLVDVFEYEGGKKMPYKADDLQMEFVMLDPHVRLPLQHNGRGTYSVRFEVPDVYGVFKYVVDYRHLGVSYIQLQHQVPVRPYKHNEYERFLLCAYPYYASAFSAMAAFFALGFFYLYHK